MWSIVDRENHKQRRITESLTLCICNNFISVGLGTKIPSVSSSAPRSWWRSTSSINRSTEFPSQDQSSQEKKSQDAG